ncbi:MAG: hypothetical protein HY907_20040 [Deltaproteobacteria bacterium]|nr:hypothetical protein [Deltaproteobacteria bacterium]
MSKYLIESHHTPEECLKALDSVLEQQPALLDKFQWGCSTGNHTGWALVEGSSRSAVEGLVPTDIRPKSTVTPVSKYTPEQIRAYHEKK